MEKGTNKIVVRLNNGDQIKFTDCGIDLNCDNNFVFRDDEGDVFGIIPRENVVYILVASTRIQRS